MDMEQMYGLLGMNQSRNAASPVAQPVAQPVARPAAQPVSAEMSNLDRLNQLMSGSRSDFIRGLGTWDKVGLAGRALQNFGRPDAADPVQAMRQEQLQALQGRMQVEQLRAAAAQRQQQANAMNAFVETLPEEQRALFPGLDDEGQSAMLREHMTPQPFQLVNTNGEYYMTFRNREPIKLNLPRGRDIAEVNTGSEIRFIDRNTNEVLQTLPLEMSPYQTAMVNQGAQRIEISRQVADRPSSSGGGSDVKIREVPYRIQGGGTGIARGEDLGGGWFRLVDGPHAGIVISRLRPSSPDSESNL